MASAAKTVPNPFFLTKIFAVIVAVTILRVLQVRIFRDPDVDNKPLAPMGRMLGISLLALWMIATIAGRLIGYSVDLISPI